MSEAPTRLHSPLHCQLRLPAQTTAVFSVINTVLLKPLIFPDQDSLVDLTNTSPRGSGGGANVPKFKIWREQTSIFSKVAGFDFGGAGLNLTGGDKPQQVQGVHVTRSTFRCWARR
jgi:putative ABC transport system permease protein